MGTRTTYLNLYKPLELERGWANEVNDSLDVIDAALHRVDQLRNIAQFGEVDLTGTTSSQTTVNTAVQDAFANGDWLYWPAGIYNCPASIPNLHRVKHIGPGIIKRGSDVFYVCPRLSQSNTLYVATTGSDNNDGLSSSQPFLTFLAVFDALNNYGPVLAGEWNIVGAAGTYTVTRSQMLTTPSTNRLVVRGPVAGHPNVPTLIIDGTGGAAFDHGIYCQGWGINVEVRDMLFQNFVGSNARIGLVAEHGPNLLATNVHATNCDWTGLYFFNADRGYVSGGILDGCRSGVITNDTELTVGYGAASTAEGTIIRNCTQSGIYFSRGGQGHIDFCVVDTNAVGIDIDTKSRAHLVSNDIRKNTVGLRVTDGNFTDTTNNFNDGTANANTTRIQYRAFAGEADDLNDYTGTLRVAQDRTVHTHTGTVAQTTLSTPWTIPAYRLGTIDTNVLVKVWGRMVSVTSGSIITVDFGGAGFDCTVLGTPSPNAAFELTAQLFEVPGAGWRVLGHLLQSANAVRVGNNSISFDPTTAQAITVDVTLANSADQLILDRVHVFLEG